MGSPKRDKRPLQFFFRIFRCLFILTQSTGKSLRASDRSRTIPSSHRKLEVIYMFYEPRLSLYNDCLTSPIPIRGEGTLRRSASRVTLEKGSSCSSAKWNHSARHLLIRPAPSRVTSQGSHAAPSLSSRPCAPGAHLPHF